MQRSQLDLKTQRNDTFERPTVSSAQCVFGLKNYPD